MSFLMFAVPKQIISVISSAILPLLFVVSFDHLHLLVDLNKLCINEFEPLASLSYLLSPAVYLHC